MKPTRIFVDRDALAWNLDRPHLVTEPLRPMIVVEYPDGSEARGFGATWAGSSRLVYDPTANPRAHVWLEVWGPIALTSILGNWRT